MPLLHVRKVFVIQQVSTGLFLTEDLFFTKCLRHAGREVDPASAKETGEWNIGGGDFDVVGIYELDESNRELF